MTDHAPVDSASLIRQAANALAKRDAAGACGLLDAAIAAGEADASVWLLKAQAHRLQGDASSEALAIDRALLLAPSDLAVLLAKGDCLAAAGDVRAASSFYSAALQHLPRYKALPPRLQEGLRRAQSAMGRLVRELEEFVRSKLDERGVSADRAPPRLRSAVDIMFGRKRPYVQEPRYLYFPELPQIQFYERSAFPWMDRVEAAAEDVRTELKGVLGSGFTPYVTQRAERAKKDQLGLADNPDWSAFFLHRDGAAQPGAAQCPRTIAALAEAPLTQIPNRAPSILFSKLAAGAHIPAHNGMINARIVCHLPLIVPAGCEFRVGNEVRAWTEGKCWAFDDTIEHEAWNRSGQERYILIFDVWRPELSEEERVGVAALCEAIDSYRGIVAWDA